MKIFVRIKRFNSWCFSIIFEISFPGGLCLIWNLIWFLCIFEDPTKDPLMTQTERDYFKSFGFHGSMKVCVKYLSEILIFYFVSNKIDEIIHYQVLAY